MHSLHSTVTVPLEATDSWAFDIDCSRKVALSTILQWFGYHVFINNFSVGKCLG